MDHDVTMNKIRAIISEDMDLPESKITPDSTFLSLGCDSLEAVNLVALIEDEFKIDLPMENSRKMTVRDVAEFVSTR